MRYGPSGRVVLSRTGREYRFHYSGSSTTVAEGTGHDHVFEQNDAGATVAFRSTSGIAWSLTLDPLNRIREIAARDRVLRYAYSDESSIAEIVEETAAGRNRSRFAYDDAGRLIEAISDRDGAVGVHYRRGWTSLSGSFQLEYAMVPTGVVAVYDGHSWIDAEHATRGGLTALYRNDQSAYFERDPTGRITGTRHVTGDEARYFHDDLGNRRVAEYGGGGSVRYVHDAAGNIVEVEVAAPDGTVYRQRVTVGSMNRVEQVHYMGLHTLRVEYDGMGRAVAFDTGNDTVFVEYNARGGLARLISKATGLEWEPEDAMGPAMPNLDPRRAVLSGDPLVSGHPEYGVVAFTETTFELHVRDALELGVPGLVEARRLQAVAASLLTEDGAYAVADFERASNPVFQPPQYLATNCCIPVPGEPLFCWPWGYGPGGGGDDCAGVTTIEAPSPDPAPLDTANLTSGTQTALNCLRRAVNDNGGSFTLLSAYRSQSHQDHLREVWDKYQTVSGWPEGRCPHVRTNVQMEWDRHDLGYRPAARSRHSSGRAFDASWGTLNAGVDIDDLAEGCSLSRPVAGDRYHFEH